MDKIAVWHRDGAASAVTECCARSADDLPQARGAIYPNRRRAALGDRERQDQSIEAGRAANKIGESIYFAHLPRYGRYIREYTTHRISRCRAGHGRFIQGRPM